MPTMLQLAAVLRRPEATLAVLAVLPQQNRRPVEPEPEPERRQVPVPVPVPTLERLGLPQGKETNLAAPPRRKALPVHPPLRQTGLDKRLSYSSTTSSTPPPTTVAIITNSDSTSSFSLSSTPPTRLLLLSAKQQ